MSLSHSPKQNHLLDALPAGDYDRLQSHLELVPMSLGDAIATTVAIADIRTRTMAKHLSMIKAIR